MIRKFFPEKSNEWRGVGGEGFASRGGNDVGGQASVAGPIFTGCDKGLLNKRVRSQGRFNISRLDAESPDFHLTIHATEAFDISVREKTGQVAGFVESGCLMLDV